MRIRGCSVRSNVGEGLGRTKVQRKINVVDGKIPSNCHTVLLTTAIKSTHSRDEGCRSASEKKRRISSINSARADAKSNARRFSCA